MIPVSQFMPYITDIMVQHEGHTLPISTDLKIILTNYITLKSFSYQIQLHEILLHSTNRKEQSYYYWYIYQSILSQNK